MLWTTAPRAAPLVPLDQSQECEGDARDLELLPPVDDEEPPKGVDQDSRLRTGKVEGTAGRLASARARYREAARLIRGVPSAFVLAGFGTIFADSRGDAETYGASSPAEELDLFISHCWRTPRWAKFLALTFHFSAARAVAVTAAATAALLCWAVSHRLRGEPCPFPAWVYLDGMTALFLVTVLFSEQLMGRRRTLFLDKVCIHQTDDAIKQAGIRRLGDFMERSRTFLVLFDEHYFTRMWCAYEVAYFAARRGARGMAVLPMWYAPFIYAGLLGNWLAYHIGFDLEFSSGLFVWEMGALGLEKGVAMFWTVAYAPSMLLICVVLRIKHREDAALREQLRAFRAEALDCTVASDRAFVLGRMEDMWGRQGGGTKGVDAFDAFVHREVPGVLSRLIAADQVCNYGVAVLIFLPAVFGGCIDVSTVSQEVIEASIGAGSTWLQYFYVNANFYATQVCCLYPCLLALLMRVAVRLGPGAWGLLVLYLLSLALLFAMQIVAVAVATGAGGFLSWGVMLGYALLTLALYSPRLRGLCAAAE